MTPSVAFLVERYQTCQSARRHEKPWPMDSIRKIAREIRRVSAVAPKAEFQMSKKVARSVKRVFAQEAAAKAIASTEPAPPPLEDERKKARNARRNARKRAAAKLPMLRAAAGAAAGADAPSRSPLLPPPPAPSTTEPDRILCRARDGRIAYVKPRTAALMGLKPLKESQQRAIPKPLEPDEKGAPEPERLP